ncbi:peptidoglycan DD-metalloendopeptidase family protein [Lusitaniella coriacea LEGE 07157]|uniref:Peptidoglycan DD-metalloendopeptidase family protein n=1 Tax=Lusitaniella coriacea LEGE 07157 TaxID=945747 RepID=A0A8J7B6R4_9CYAN|nr:peptidoglycan DD-metalloendopeptidase family protein [Lusitaniella coriacea]MBE9114526.1 peptidoglycan DD-metalloendopeptidase family protein [Lusitaniella coriacea LEGE 07157]
MKYRKPRPLLRSPRRKTWQHRVIDYAEGLYEVARSRKTHPQKLRRSRKGQNQFEKTVLWLFLGAIALDRVSMLLGNPSQVLILPTIPFSSAQLEPKTVSPPAAKAAQLFQSSQSLGAIAIGHAEGNLTSTGQLTKQYYGHSDPGNFKRNQGWCSDQGRGKGNVVRADRECLNRMKWRIPVLEKDLRQAGIDPDQNLEVFLNIADLYNQASPRVSRQFPQKYAAAKRQGKQGEEALVWARVEAFRRNNRIDASGLIGICNREKRGVSDWDCVAGDQRRRVRAIQRVLQQNSTQQPKPFMFPVQGTITQKYSSIHSGIDLAGSIGTPVLAAQSGKVVYADWNDFGLGNAIEIQHGDGKSTVYGHNQRLWVKPGQMVQQGQIIAQVGSTGFSTGPHLHFEVRDRETFLDPSPLLEPQRCARDRQTPTRITFINQTPSPLSLHWVNEQCKEIRYRTLQPGEQFAQPTYVTHAWRLRHSSTGQLQQEFIATDQRPTTVKILNNASI